MSQSPRDLYFKAWNIREPWNVNGKLSDYVEDSGGHHIWQRAMTGDGRNYGVVHIPKRITGLDGAYLIRVHRASLIRAVGLPPGEEWQVDHICKIPQCMNADHLRWATPLQNSRFKFSTDGRTCRNGHEWESDGPGGCRECARQVNARARAKHRALIRAAKAKSGLSWDDYRARYGERVGNARAILGVQ